jgi:hypothetical protein
LRVAAAFFAATLRLLVAAAFFLGVLAFGLIFASVRFVPRLCIRAEIASRGKNLPPFLVILGTDCGMRGWWQFQAPRRVSLFVPVQWGCLPEARQAQGHRCWLESRLTFLGQVRAPSPAPVRPLHGYRGPGNGESSCPPHRSSQKSGFVQSHGQWSSTPQVHLIGRGAVHWS